MTRIVDRCYLYDRSTKGVATVIGAGVDAMGSWVVLDRTWFHPQGGGQPADRGTIDGHPVAHVVNTEAGKIRHYLEAATIAIEASVSVEVEPEWRNANARRHSAGHLIAAIVESQCAQLRAVSGHHWPGEARVDFDGDCPSDVDGLRGSIEVGLDRALTEDMGIRVCGDPLRDRSIQIGDFPPMPCGGTHVRSLREVGSVVVRSLKRKSGRLRISYDVASVA